MDWTIQDLGSIGEFVGAVGVVITLGYLAYQIRQNTSQLKQNTLTAKAAAVNASNRSLRETRRSIFESEEMAEIFQQGNSDPERLKPSHLLRYRLLMQNVAEAALDIYTQTAMTGFSPETWSTQGVTMVKRVFGNSGGKWFWQNYCDNYPTQFCEEVERVLPEIKGK